MRGGGRHVGALYRVDGEHVEAKAKGGEEHKVGEEEDLPRDARCRNQASMQKEGLESTSRRGEEVRWWWGCRADGFTLRRVFPPCASSMINQSLVEVGRAAAAVATIMVAATHLDI